MAKKIKRSKTEGIHVDPKLEEVGEDRAFEIEMDEDTNEIIFVHHYRRVWGDEFNADIEHGLNLEEAEELINVLVNLTEMIKKKVVAERDATLKEKATMIPIEGNPLKENKQT